MHRISCFGTVAESTVQAFLYNYRVEDLETGTTLAYSPITIQWVAGTPGPRLETQLKGKTISGWPGGPVHDVDHYYLSGAIIPESGGGWEPLFTFSKSLVVPMCDSTFNTTVGPGEYPSLVRGEIKGRLLEVHLEKGTSPAGEPYTVRVRIQFVGCTFESLGWDTFSWIAEIHLYCPYDKDGKYRVLEIPSPKGGTGAFTWLDAPAGQPGVDHPYPIRPKPLLSFFHHSLTFKTIPPYQDSLLDYWKKEKKSLKQCVMGYDMLRDCTLEAISEATFTEALTLSNLKDLLDAMETIKAAIELAKDFKKGIKKMDPMLILKVIAGAHLIHRYVVKTTAKDLQDLVHFAKQLWEHRDAWWDYLTIARGRCREKEYTQLIKKSGRIYSCAVNLRFDMRPAQYQLITYLRRVGLSPNLVGFWDMIPLSFVVDWVLPVGETIEAYEVLTDLEFLKFLSVSSLRSHRLVDESIYPGLRLRGMSSRFRRVVSSHYQGSPYAPEFRMKNPIKNLWTALALIVATVKGAK